MTKMNLVMTQAHIYIKTSPIMSITNGKTWRKFYPLSLRIIIILKMIWTLVAGSNSHPNTDMNSISHMPWKI